MRILILLNAYHTLSGGDRIAAECGKRWIRSGDLVEFLTNRRGASFLAASGIPARAIRTGPGSGSDRFGTVISTLYKTAVGAVRALGDPKPDVAFASSYLPPDLLPALLLRWHRRTPVVVALYHLLPRPGTEGYAPGIVGWLLHLVQEVSRRVVTRFADGLVTAGPRTAQRLRAEGAKTVLEVRGGVDADALASAPASAERYDAVFVGRFHPQKGVGELLSIWGAVAAEDPRRTLALVGAGGLERELRNRVDRTGLSKNVRFLGPLDGPAKAGVIKAGALFVSASRFDQGNIALDEALACGTPGVVYDLPGQRYPAGVVQVPVGDTAAFTAAVRRLLADPDERTRLGQAGQRFARGLDWNRTATTLRDFLAALGESRHPREP